MFKDWFDNFLKIDKMEVILCSVHVCKHSTDCKQVLLRLMSLQLHRPCNLSSNNKKPFISQTKKLSKVQWKSRFEIFGKMI